MNKLTTQQAVMLVRLNGLRDQIKKGQFLNVHFRAFELANDAWHEHIRQNAVLNAERMGGKAGAVLDDAREDR